MTRLKTIKHQFSTLWLSLMAMAIMIVTTGCGEDEDESDLTVSNISSPITAEAGEAISIVSTVKNSGSKTAKGEEYEIWWTYTITSGFRVGIYLSADDTITTGDKLLGSWYVHQLNAGRSTSGQDVIVIPEGTEPGTYYIGVYVDDLGQEDERRERNNTLAFEITITEAPPQTETPLEIPVPELDVVDLDLTIASVMDDGPGIYCPGDPISIDNVVENIGTVPAYLVSVALYASTDPEITTSDIFLGHTTISVLGPGAIDQDITLCRIPESTPEGMYFIGAIVDGDDQWPEWDEGNNAVAGSSTIEVVSPSR